MFAIVLFIICFHLHCIRFPARFISPHFSIVLEIIFVIEYLFACACVIVSSCKQISVFVYFCDWEAGKSPINLCFLLRSNSCRAANRSPIPFGWLRLFCHICNMRTSSFWVYFVTFKCYPWFYSLSDSGASTRADNMLIQGKCPMISDVGKHWSNS